MSKNRSQKLIKCVRTWNDRIRLCICICICTAVIAIIIVVSIQQRQHATKQKLYGHQPPITKTIKIRRTRHAGHCWKCRDELIYDVLLWTPSHGRGKAERSARTYIQQLCVDRGSSPEDRPEAMDDMEGWRKRVRDISAADELFVWSIDFNGMSTCLGLVYA